MIHRYDRRASQFFSPQHERIAAIDVVVGGHMAIGVHDQQPRKVLDMDILLNKIVVNLNAIRGQERRKRFDRGVQIVRRLGFSSLFVAIIFFASVFQRRHGLLTESKRFIEAAMRADHKQQIQQDNTGNNADDYDNQVLFVQGSLIICHGFAPCSLVVAPAL